MLEFIAKGQVEQIKADNHSAIAFIQYSTNEEVPHASLHVVSTNQKEIFFSYNIANLERKKSVKINDIKRTDRD